MAFRESFLKDVLSDPDFRRMKASGRLEAFLKSSDSYTASDERFIQYATHYARQAERGRGPTRNPTGGLWAAIYEWLELKKYGITYADDKERKGIAWAITTTIRRQGSYNYRRGIDAKIFERALEKNLPVLLKNLGGSYSDEYQQNLIKAWRQQ